MNNISDSSLRDAAVCTKPDDYTSEREMWNTVWHIYLSNGEEVWDDDRRPGLELPSWIRLKQYCETNNLYIERMYLRFRSHYEHIEAGQDGYFLLRKALAHWGGDTNHYFICGVLKNGILEATEWRCPELIPEKTYVRNFDNDGDFLIAKPRKV